MLLYKIIRNDPLPQSVIEGRKVYLSINETNRQREPALDVRLKDADTGTTLWEVSLPHQTYHGLIKEFIPILLGAVGVKFEAEYSIADITRDVEALKQICYTYPDGYKANSPDGPVELREPPELPEAGVVFEVPQLRPVFRRAPAIHPNGIEHGPVGGYYIWWGGIPEWAATLQEAELLLARHRDPQRRPEVAPEGHIGGIARNDPGPVQGGQ